MTTALLRSAGAGPAVREPLVRTVHGYAYAVLRRGGASPARSAARRNTAYA
ncbi:hypothetical protein MAHJHV28_46920 [Mycobacterium avium subsp. hominissuis]